MAVETSQWAVSRASVIMITLPADDVGPCPAASVPSRSNTMAGGRPSVDALADRHRQPRRPGAGGLVVGLRVAVLAAGAGGGDGRLDVDGAAGGDEVGARDHPPGELRAAVVDLHGHEDAVVDGELAAGDLEVVVEGVGEQEGTRLREIPGVAGVVEV